MKPPSMNGSMKKTGKWTVGELLSWATKDFKQRDIETARLDAELLLAHALGAARMELYTRFDRVPEKEVLDRFRSYIKRRREREPVAHITGKKEFHDIEVMVRPGMFVPRPETEVLVDEALQRVRGVHEPRVLDLCNGCGAIALAILKAMPGARVWATDIEPEATELARENARALGLEQRITLLTGDLYEPVQALPPFDMVTANPPYIRTGELGSMMSEVKDHEKWTALDGGKDGLEVTGRIVAGAKARLRPGGWLLVEVGFDQASQVEEMAGAGLVHEATREDIHRIPRAVIFRLASRT